MNSVNRERALGLRLLISGAADGNWMRYRDMYDLLDIIDSYIAQLSRPATEFPQEEVDVLLETTDNGWRQAVVIKLWDSKFQWSGYKDGAAGDYIPSENVIRWIPLPDGVDDGE